MKRTTLIFPFGKFGLLCILALAAYFQARGAEMPMPFFYQSSPGDGNPLHAAVMVSEIGEVYFLGFDAEAGAAYYGDFLLTDEGTFSAEIDGNAYWGMYENGNTLQGDVDDALTWRAKPASRFGPLGDRSGVWDGAFSLGGDEGEVLVFLFPNGKGHLVLTYADGTSDYARFKLPVDEDDDEADMEAGEEGETDDTSSDDDDGMTDDDDDGMTDDEDDDDGMTEDDDDGTPEDDDAPVYPLEVAFTTTGGLEGAIELDAEGGMGGGLSDTELALDGSWEAAIGLLLPAVQKATEDGDEDEADDDDYHRENPHPFTGVYLGAFPDTPGADFWGMLVAFNGKARFLGYHETAGLADFQFRVDADGSFERGRLLRRISGRLGDPVDGVFSLGDAPEDTFAFTGSAIPVEGDVSADAAGLYLGAVDLPEAEGGEDRALAFLTPDGRLVFFRLGSPEPDGRGDAALGPVMVADGTFVLTSLRSDTLSGAVNFVDGQISGEVVPFDGGDPAPFLLTLELSVSGLENSLEDRDIKLKDFWAVSPWFGAYYRLFFPWIYHPEHGWVKLHPSRGKGSKRSGGNQFLFDPKLGWLMTSAERHPYFYCWKLKSWIYYDEDGSADGKRWFFVWDDAYSDGEWRSDDDIADDADDPEG